MTLSSVGGVLPDNSKGFSEYVNSKKRSEENFGLTINDDVHLRSRDEGYSFL